MKAVLVYWSAVARVVVPDDASEEIIIYEAQSKIREKLAHDFYDNLEEIVDDIEVPYDPKFDKY